MNICLHRPAGPIKADIAIKGSKSICNRVLIIRAISGLRFDILNMTDAEDTHLLQQALQQVRQHGNREIDVNHAGTDFRFLTALLAMTAGEWTLTGSTRMKQRPVGELVSVLRQLGAEITYTDEEGFPPLHITGKTLAGGKAEIRGSISSQFISALLLVAPYFEKGLQLTITTGMVSKPYIDMTIAVMQQFGISVTQQGNHINVKAGQYLYEAPAYTIEGDWSSASYWYSIAALSDQCEIRLRNLSSNSLQADSVVRTLYENFGVTTMADYRTATHSLVLQKNTVSFRSIFQYDFIHCPDLAQTVACTCLGLGIPAKLTGLQTLRIKETDRIMALKQELEAFGAQVDTNDQSLHLAPLPGSSSSVPCIRTYHDHRMAMSFAPLCLLHNGLCIEDAAVVQKSYPGFWKDLEAAGFTITPQP